MMNRRINVIMSAVNSALSIEVVKKGYLRPAYVTSLFAYWIVGMRHWILLDSEWSRLTSSQLMDIRLCNWE
jgi:hypothetical protein